MNFEECFKRKFDEPDLIKHVTLDCNLTSHCKKIIAEIEKKAWVCFNKTDIRWTRSLYCQQREIGKIDQMITDVLDFGWKKVEGQRRSIPCSTKKLERWSGKKY